MFSYCCHILLCAWIISNFFDVTYLTLRQCFLTFIISYFECVLFYNVWYWYILLLCQYCLTPVIPGRGRGLPAASMSSSCAPHPAVSLDAWCHCTECTGPRRGCAAVPWDAPPLSTGGLRQPRASHVHRVSLPHVWRRSRRTKCGLPAAKTRKMSDAGCGGTNLDCRVSSNLWSKNLTNCRVWSDLKRYQINYMLMMHDRWPYLVVICILLWVDICTFFTTLGHLSTAFGHKMTHKVRYSTIQSKICHIWNTMYVTFGIQCTPRRGTVGGRNVGVLRFTLTVGGKSTSFVVSQNPATTLTLDLKFGTKLIKIWLETRGSCRM